MWCGVVWCGLSGIVWYIQELIPMLMMYVCTCVQAQAESDKLRAVVIPLEEEIASLKNKLQEAEETIKALELSSSSTTPLIDFTVDDEAARSPEDGEREAEKQLVADEEEVQPGTIQQQGEGALGVKVAVAAKSRKLKVRTE